MGFVVELAILGSLSKNMSIITLAAVPSVSNVIPLLGSEGKILHSAETFKLERFDSCSGSNGELSLMFGNA